MIKFLPSDAMINVLGGFTSKLYTSGDWFMIYEWFCRKLTEWMPENTPFEVMNATSSINNHRFNCIGGIDSPCQRLSYLFKYFDSYKQKEFLNYLKIRRWNDLAKPIFIKGGRPKTFPKREWFEMQGRVFRESPNSCHPKATYVQDFSLQFSDYKKRWYAHIHYGYPHDSGSWEFSITQNYREHLDTFAGRIQGWIDETLKPDPRPGIRQERERRWARAYSASKDLFWHDMNPCNMEDQIADELVKIEGTSLTEGRIVMNPRRLATLKRWAKIDMKKRKCGPE